MYVIVQREYALLNYLSRGHLSSPSFVQRKQSYRRNFCSTLRPQQHSTAPTKRNQSAPCLILGLDNVAALIKSDLIK
jgi:hypothetical protein